MEMTNEEVGRAFEEMKSLISSGIIDETKMAKLNIVLDAHEESNQKLVTAQNEIKQHELAVAELKSELEVKGEEAGKVRERVDELEAAYARRQGINEHGVADYHETDEYKALNTWCKLGDTNTPLEIKALLRTDSAVDGGLLTMTEMDTVILKKIIEIDPIRGAARVRTISNKAIELPIRNTIPIATYEGEAETGGDSASTYQNTTITPFRQTHTTPVTKDQLMDSVFDIESEIVTDSGEAFAFGEGNGFVVGTGFKQPSGFVADAILQAAARATATASIIAPEDLILLTGDLKAGYNAQYAFTRASLAKFRTFRADAVNAADSAGAFLWAPGLDGGVSSTINGFPYMLANSMPEIADDAYSVAFCDFARGYTIVDRTGMSIVRDEFTLKKKAIVEFTMNRWNTGMVTLHEAMKLLKVSS